jgi:hypothetical protein
MLKAPCHTCPSHLSCLLAFVVILNLEVKIMNLDWDGEGHPCKGEKCSILMMIVLMG